MMCPGKRENIGLQRLRGVFVIGVEAETASSKPPVGLSTSVLGKGAQAGEHGMKRATCFFPKKNPGRKIISSSYMMFLKN